MLRTWGVPCEVDNVCGYLSSLGKMTCIVQMNCSEFFQSMNFWPCLQEHNSSWNKHKGFEKQNTLKSSIFNITYWDIMDNYDSALDNASLKSQGDEDIQLRKKCTEESSLVRQLENDWEEEPSNYISPPCDQTLKTDLPWRLSSDKSSETKKNNETVIELQIPSATCIDAIVRQLENDWVEEPSNYISPPCDQTLKTDLPWRLSSDKSSETKKNNETVIELQIPSATCIDTIFINPSVQREVNDSELCLTVSAINSEEFNELTFLHPGACWGDIIVMEKSDLETEFIDVENDDQNETSQEKSSFKVSEELHAGRISRNKFGQWVCNICNEAYKSTLILKRHVKKHYSACINECLECHISFDNSEDLDFHQVSHFLSSLVLGHICKHCYKSFRRKHLLEKHVAAEHCNFISR